MDKYLVVVELTCFVPMMMLEKLKDGWIIFAVPRTPCKTSAKPSLIQSFRVSFFVTRKTCEGMVPILTIVMYCFAPIFLKIH